MDEEAFIISNRRTRIALISGMVLAFTFLTYNPLGEPRPRNADYRPMPESKAEMPVQTAEEAVSHQDEAAVPSIEVPASVEKRSRIFNPIILKAALRYEVDPALVKAIIMAESAYNPSALSSRGAAGLMQLMPETAEALGVEDAFDPEHNVDAGVRYLKQLLEEFDHDLKMALAAYNAGITLVKRRQGIPPFKATRRYIEKVFAYYRYFQQEAGRETDRV